MLMLSTNAAVARIKSKTNGAAYPPLEVWSEEQAVAINDAAIRLKFVMLRFAAKYFCP